MRARRWGLLPDRRGSRGVAAVELALVLPIFMILLLGTAELGRALYQYNTLTKSVRVAAQYVSRNSLVGGYVDISTTTRNTARNLVVYGKPTAGTDGQELLEGMTVNDVTISEVTIPPAGGPTYVNVTATYTFLKLFNVIPTFGIGSNISTPGSFTASITMVALS